MIRLLIADDERLEREALVEMVSRRFEHEVVLETAENGRKAADAAILWGADLILMDIEMPGMSGLDAARAVLAQRPGCRVVFVTAYSLFQYAHEAVHLGACDYLLKPVDPDETEAAIRRAIRQIEAGRRLAELAAAAPEPETAPEQETDPAGEGESDRNALVMDHVRKYMEDNYMADLSLDIVQKVPEDELSGLPDRAAHQRRQGAAVRPLPLRSGGGLHGGLRGRQLLCPRL